MSDPYNREIEWFLLSAAAELGERSNMGSFLARMDRGGASADANSDPYTDQQIGFGPRWRGRGSVERARAVARIWCELRSSDQRVLRAYYLPARNLPPGAAGRLSKYAGVSFLLTADPGALASACQRGDSALRAARDGAVRAVRAAHAAFDAAGAAAERAWMQ